MGSVARLQSGDGLRNTELPATAISQLFLLPFPPCRPELERPVARHDPNSILLLQHRFVVFAYRIAVSASSGVLHPLNRTDSENQLPVLADKFGSGSPDLVARFGQFVRERRHVWTAAEARASHAAGLKAIIRWTGSRDHRTISAGSTPAPRPGPAPG
jgi:hypothetical protein